MNGQTQPVERARIGPFELNFPLGELRKHGIRLKIHDQPLRILEMLASRPGELVTREEIRQRLWPSGTFVDFDNGLNSAINRLRSVLADSAEAPKVIETIPRRGYRLVAPVEIVSVASVLERRLKAQPPHGTPVVAAASRHWLYWLLPACTVLFLLVVATGLRYFSRQSRVAAARDGRVVIAVLAFDNLTGNANQEYLADGLTEELTSELARFDPAHLGVIARTTATAYKGTNKTIAQIGSELRAQYLLECSLREQANRMRVSAQLVRTSDQTHIWARDYERDLVNVLDLEDDLAADIAREVKVQLTPEQRLFARAPKVANPAAYDAYLQGRFLFGTRSKESMFRAVDFFKRSASLDPNYAPAYTGLAETYLILGGGYMPSGEAYELGRIAAVRALQLDDHLAEAHAALGYFKFIDEWDWDGADREFRKAIELNPEDANAHHWYAAYLAAFRRDSEATSQIAKALELDPLSIANNYTAGYVYCEIGHYAEAVDRFRRALELDPRSSAAHGGLALAYSYQHRFDDALVEYAAAQRINGTVAQFAGPVAVVYAQMGKAAEARKLLENLIEISKSEHVPSYNFALAYVASGNKAQAFYWLEKAAQERELTVTEVTTDHRIDLLRTDPRFRRLLAQFHLASR